jgi:hypothetical protein
MRPFLFLLLFIPICGIPLLSHAAFSPSELDRYCGNAFILTQEWHQMAELIAATDGNIEPSDESYFQDLIEMTRSFTQNLEQRGNLEIQMIAQDVYKNLKLVQQNRAARQTQTTVDACMEVFYAFRDIQDALGC